MAGAALLFPSMVQVSAEEVGPGRGRRMGKVVE